jgi:NAD-dependent deacetylase
MESVIKLKKLVDESNNIVVFTGAGISAESGIPTYRGKGGYWDKYDPDKYANINYFNQDPSYYWNFFKDVRSPVLRKAKPNIIHKCIAKLESSGKVRSIITQNIDGLHKEAGSKNILELHGNTRMFSCMKCYFQFNFHQINALLEKKNPPECTECNSLIRPNVILFGEALNPDILSRAQLDSSCADLFIAAGSSLLVQPASLLPVMAKENGAKLVIVNLDPTPLDAISDLIINISASRVFSKIIDV